MVTYFPDEKIEERIFRIVKLVDLLIIVDNTPNSSAVELLASIKKEVPVRLILNSKNLGVATALNQGIDAASSMGYAWALLFDQDSQPCDNILIVLSECYNDFFYKDKIALIGSNYFKGKEFLDQFSIEKKCTLLDVDNVITSGTLLSIKKFNLIGKFRENFFIDNVDIEYCLRAKKKGFLVLMTRSKIMKHNIGEPSEHLFFGRKIGVSNHPPLRRYYMMRNDIVLLREYIFVYPIKALKIIYFRMVYTFFMLIFEKEKRKKAVFTLLGLWDGIISNFSRNFTSSI